MKNIISLLLVISPLVSTAQTTSSEQFYQASKYMIVNSTAIRIDAANKNDFTKVCRVVPRTAGSPSMDTMAYYLSFEIFMNSTLSKRFYKEVGPFAARNYESMFHNKLPHALHSACISGDKEKIKKAISDIYFTSILE